MSVGPLGSSNTTKTSVETSGGKNHKIQSSPRDNMIMNMTTSSYTRCHWHCQVGLTVKSVLNAIVLACTVCLCFETGQCSAIPCPCSDSSLCKQVSPKFRNEVMIFVVAEDNWQLYDWNKITTVVKFGSPNYNLTCFAHSKGVRVVSGGTISKFELGGLLGTSSGSRICTADIPAANLTVPSDRKLWIAKQVKDAQANFYDGINVDFEAVIKKTDIAGRAGLSALMKELAFAFRATFKDPQITFDVPWSPDCIDRRCYDFPALAKYSDFLFVMAYDERSQFSGECIAWANSPLNTTTYGLDRFLALGIPPRKLVLGVPWYGYSYKCMSLTKTNVCRIKCASFRGSECSDSVGRQKPYSEIVEKYLRNSTSGLLWDQVAKSPYFNFKNKDNTIYQIWYDNPKSLKMKYDYAVKIKLLGVGMWNADTLDYTNTAAGAKQRKDMWGALPYGHGFPWRWGYHGNSVMTTHN